MVLLKATLYLKPYKRTGDRVLKSDALHLYMRPPPRALWVELQLELTSHASSH